MNKRLLPATSAAGTAVVLAGLVTAAINSEFTLMARLFCVGGGCLLVFSLVAGFESFKRFMMSRGTRYQGSTTLLVVIIIAVLGMINFIVTRHNKRFDFTEAGLYSLSGQTRQVVTALGKDVHVTVFVPGGNKASVADLFDEYRLLNDRITVEYLDINREPGRAKELGVTRDGTVVVQCGARSESFIQQPEEALVTNAILKVTREGVNTVFFTTGHGERDPGSSDETGCGRLKEALEEEGFECRTLLLMKTGAVPEACDVLIIAGADKEFTVEEKGELARYLDTGGRLLLLLDPDKPSFKKLLEPWQVAVGENVVVDVNPANRSVGASEFMPIAVNYEPHAITDNFRAATIFPLVRSVTPAADKKEGVKAEVLVKTSRQSWGETEYGGSAVQFDETKDIRGPVPVALAVSSYEKSRKDPDEFGADSARVAATEKGALTRLIVAGDSECAANAYLGFAGNRDLLLNMVNWLSQAEDMITIRPRQQRDRRIFLTLKQSRLIFWFSVVVIPLLVLAAGLWVWLGRKK